ncbi:hypothetical protein ACEPAH_2266 [Sanghuangporus vaninii]
MSTHYSLEVIRLEDLQWKRTLHRTDPNLYASLSIGDVTERTRTIKRTRFPIWNETFTFPASYESEDLEVQVIHESSVLPDSYVGVGSVKLGDLLSRSSAEVPLDVVSPKREAEITGRIFLRLSYIDAMEAVGLNIREAAQGVQRPGIAQSADVSNIVQSIDDGATQLGSQDELYKAVGELLQRLEVFERVIDTLSELHPFFNIAWSLTSALYKAVKNVFEADKKVIDLVRTMSEAFLITIECCIFVRKYTSRGFAGRMLEFNSCQKIDEFRRVFDQLKREIDSGVTLHTAFISMRAARRIDALLLHQQLNPGHFDAFKPVSLSVHFLEFPLGLSHMMQASHPFFRAPVVLPPCFLRQLCKAHLTFISPCFLSGVTIRSL